MGNTQCKTDKKDSYLWLIILRKLNNKDTPLDKKIHNEYMDIIGIKDFQFDQVY